MTEAEEGPTVKEVAMLKRTATAVGVLVFALVTVLVVFLVGMRAKSPLVLNAVRKINRAVMNPRQMESAGTVGAYASVIRHSGRASGRPYETPVGVVATDDGFVIALPYGSQADWLKNVLASGSAEIVNEGHTYRVDQPEIIPTEAAVTHFPSKEQRNLRLFGVDQCLRIRRVEAEEAREPVTDPQPKA
jgi:deazaflavin-dependent oxidoreductase (nitroreductase family)